MDEYGRGVAVGKIVSDDDSKLRANYRRLSNGGRLRETTFELYFLYGLGHRVKTITKKLFEMVTKSNNPNEVQMIDALRLKKYLFCYIYQSITGDLEEFLKPSQTPIESQFNNHQFYHP